MTRSRTLINSPVRARAVTVRELDESAGENLIIDILSMVTHCLAHYGQAESIYPSQQQHTMSTLKGYFSLREVHSSHLYPVSALYDETESRVDGSTQLEDFTPYASHCRNAVIDILQAIAVGEMSQ